MKATREWTSAGFSKRASLPSHSACCSMECCWLCFMARQFSYASLDGTTSSFARLRADVMDKREIKALSRSSIFLIRFNVGLPVPVELSSPPEKTRKCGQASKLRDFVALFGILLVVLNFSAVRSCQMKRLELHRFLPKLSLKFERFF